MRNINTLLLALQELTEEEGLNGWVLTSRVAGRARMTMAELLEAADVLAACYDAVEVSNSGLEIKINSAGVAEHLRIEALCRRTHHATLIQMGATL
jgi:hypothetical protein